MSLIPRTFIHDLLARCDVVEIIDAHVPLKKRGHNYIACCPFHNEKTPSFTVSPMKQFYHCFGCGKSGNVISFLMEYEHLTFVEAVEQLAQQAGIEIPYEKSQITVNKNQNNDLSQFLEQVAHYYQQQLKNTPQAIDYLKKRGLTGQIAKDFLLGYAPDQWDFVLKKFGDNKNNIQQLLDGGLLIKKDSSHYDRFRDRIMFAIRNRRGRVIGFGGRILEKGEPKYLNSPETIMFHKGRELYGLYEAQRAQQELKQMIVVEGYMDVIALAQHGIKNAAATLGTATTPDHIQQLFRITSEVIFCFDGDKAGQKAAWRALETSLPLLQDGWQIRFLFLPEGEDPDSVVRRVGQENFRQQLAQATPLADFLFKQLSLGIDLTTLEGKARFAKQAVNLIKKIPAEILPQLLLDRLAKLLQMDISALHNIAQIKNIANKQVIAKSPTKNKRSSMRIAIAVLVQYPQLIASLQDTSFIQTLTLPGSNLLRELILFLQQTPNMTAGNLLEYWRERPEYSMLAQLDILDLHLSENNFEAVFLDTIKNLQQLDCQMKIGQLMQKKQLSGLTAEENQYLQMLITDSKK